MQFQVLLPVVGFLEEDICADSRSLEFTVTLYVRCGNVHVHAADGIAALVHGVNGFDGLQDILQGVIHGIFPGFYGKPLVAGADKSPDLCRNLILGEFTAGNRLVLIVVGAVYAAVNAVV